MYPHYSTRVFKICSFRDLPRREVFGRDRPNCRTRRHRLGSKRCHFCNVRESQPRNRCLEERKLVVAGQQKGHAGTMTLFLDEGTVKALVNMDDALAATEEVFREAGNGHVTNVPRVRVPLNDGTLRIT